MRLAAAPPHMQTPAPPMGIRGAASPQDAASDPLNSRHWQHTQNTQLRHTYERIKLIGKGTYGKAYLVRSKHDNRFYVMKTVSLLAVRSEKERKNALQEVRLLQVLNHPNVVAYKDSMISSDQLHIVMQYCEGGDLHSVIRAHAKAGTLVPERQVWDWLIQLALALRYMHGAKILHRDLKTQNVFLTANNVIKLGDLGIARMLDNTADLVRTVVGTPYYMSPELVQNRPYNHASDVWALGCVMYETVALKPAFDSKDMSGLVSKILKGSYADFHESYSDDLRVLIRLMLARDPKNRPKAGDILELPFVKKNIEVMLSQGPYTSLRGGRSEGRSEGGRETNFGNNNVGAGAGAAARDGGGAGDASGGSGGGGGGGELNLQPAPGAFAAAAAAWGDPPRRAESPDTTAGRGAEAGRAESPATAAAAATGITAAERAALFERLLQEKTRLKQFGKNIKAANTPSGGQQMWPSPPSAFQPAAAAAAAGSDALSKPSGKCAGAGPSSISTAAVSAFNNTASPSQGLMRPAESVSGVPPVCPHSDPMHRPAARPADFGFPALYSAGPAPGGRLPQPPQAFAAFNGFNSVGPPAAPPLPSHGSLCPLSPPTPTVQTDAAALEPRRVAPASAMMNTTITISPSDSSPASAPAPVTGGLSQQGAGSAGSRYAGSGGTSTVFSFAAPEVKATTVDLSQTASPPPAGPSPPTSGGPDDMMSMTFGRGSKNSLADAMKQQQQQQQQQQEALFGASLAPSGRASVTESAASKSEQEGAMQAARSTTPSSPGAAALASGGVSCGDGIGLGRRAQSPLANTVVSPKAAHGGAGGGVALFPSLAPAVSAHFAAAADAEDYADDGFEEYYSDDDTETTTGLPPPLQIVSGPAKAMPGHFSAAVSPAAGGDASQVNNIAAVSDVVDLCGSPSPLCSPSDNNPGLHVSTAYDGSVPINSDGSVGSAQALSAYRGMKKQWEDRYTELEQEVRSMDNQDTALNIYQELTSTMAQAGPFRMPANAPPTPPGMSFNVTAGTANTGDDCEDDDLFSTGPLSPDE